MRRLRIPDEVAGLIRGLHPDLKRKVRSALDDILADPTVGKTLREEPAGLRSCRVARFRIIYRVAGAVIEIVAVGPRQTIYEETWRKVRRPPAKQDRHPDTSGEIIGRSPARIPERRHGPSHPLILRVLPGDRQCYTGACKRQAEPPSLSPDAHGGR